MKNYAEYNRKPNFNNIDVRQYDPKGIFAADNNHPMGGGNQSNSNLSKAFYNARYNNNGSFKNIGGANSFKRNAGAVQLFNRGNGNPLIDAISSISDPVYLKYTDYLQNTNQQLPQNPQNYADVQTSYGHSERVGMRDTLDNFIRTSYWDQQRQAPQEGVPIRPSDSTRQKLNDQHQYPNGISNNNKEILYNLQRRAGEYKDLLENPQNPAIVKMWSERPPCNTNALGGGGHCSDFIQSVFPDGSQYGFISPDDTEQNVNNVSTIFKNTYQSQYPQQQMQPLPGMTGVRTGTTGLPQQYGQYQHQGLFAQTNQPIVNQFQQQQQLPSRIPQFPLWGPYQRPIFHPEDNDYFASSATENYFQNLYNANHPLQQQQPQQQQGGAPPPNQQQQFQNQPGQKPPPPPPPQGGQQQFARGGRVISTNPVIQQIMRYNRQSTNPLVRYLLNLG